jgi:ElaB/YqjD/DUF883 family membrane-anchored ribosome-binding protein
MSDARVGYPSAQAEGSQHASATGEKISEVTRMTEHAVEAQYEKLSTAIRAKPIQSAGIAVGLGFLLALLARR